MRYIITIIYFEALFTITNLFKKMMISNTDTDKYVQLIEDGITKDYINNYYDYNEFQDIRCIGFGAYGRVYRTIWESSDTVVALKSFEFNNCVMKEIEKIYFSYFFR